MRSIGPVLMNLCSIATGRYCSCLAMTYFSSCTCVGGVRGSQTCHPRYKATVRLHLPQFQQPPNDALCRELNANPFVLTVMKLQRSCKATSAMSGKESRRVGVWLMICLINVHSQQGEIACTLCIMASFRIRISSSLHTLCIEIIILCMLSAAKSFAIIVILRPPYSHQLYEPHEVMLILSCSWLMSASIPFAMQ